MKRVCSRLKRGDFCHAQCNKNRPTRSTPLAAAVLTKAASAGRREPRDILDLVFIHENYIPLGAVVWAAVAKDPGFSPESLIAEIRRNARYRADDYADLAVAEPVDAAKVSRDLRQILDAAESFVAKMPVGQEGLAYLLDGNVVQPDPDNLAVYATHAGKRQGHWPSSSEIGSAMLERYATPKG